MIDPARVLVEFQPAYPFFVGVDAEGCLLDTMNLQHQECFVPLFIRCFGLQAVSRQARAVWEFVTLRSRTRGINRFPALSNALNLLAEHPEAQARGVGLWSTDALDAWLARETSYTNDTLRAAIAGGDEALEPVLAWSVAVDAALEEMVPMAPLFPGVRETLGRLSEVADAVVISETPVAVLDRACEDHGLQPYFRAVAGQECGSKTDLLRLAALHRYEPKHALMVGDAPGDFRAARAAHALFYPIVPGCEEDAWARLHSEALDLFLSGRYAGDYETMLLQEFHAALPERPPWSC